MLNAALFFLLLNGFPLETGQDPQSLLAEASAALADDRLDVAERAVESTRQIILWNPSWDPDRSFADRLVPNMENRIARHRSLLTRLEQLADRVQEEGPPRPPAGGENGLSSYLQWARDRTAWARAEVERLTAEMPPAPENCPRAPSIWPEAARFLEEDTFPEMSRSLREQVSAMQDDSERVRALRTRLEDLKRQVVASAVKQETLREQLASVRTQHGEYLNLLLELIGVDRAEVGDPGNTSAAAISDALARRIRDRRLEIRTLTRCTSLDKALGLEEIGRFHLANSALVIEGAPDLTGRINVLASALETLQVSDQSLDPSLKWVDCCMSECRQ